jgi:hypothetical protein
MTTATTPGPGQYEIYNSFVSIEHMRKLKNDASNRKARHGSLAALSIVSGGAQSYQ